MQILGRALILFSLCVLTSCVQGPDLSEVPTITYQGLSKDTLNQGTATEDFLTLFFHVEDGDGDIGHDPEDNTFNLFVFDSRTGNLYDQPNLIPKVPEGVSSKGVFIDLELTLFETCCRFPDNIPPCNSPPQYPLDSLTLDIYIVDRAGNQSNTVTSETLYLRCN